MNDKIIQLRGPDRVRKRPAVVFGSDGIDGAKAAVTSLLDIFVSEAMLGYCSSISVTQNEEDITVSCDDRGLYLGQELPESDNTWESVFCELFPGPQSGPDEQEYQFSFFDQHHGLFYGDHSLPEDVFLPDTSGINDLCLLQYASEVMRVTVVRNSVRSGLYFERGYNVGGIQNTKSDECTGTTIQLKLDSDVFSETALKPSFFIDALKTYAMLVPCLQTHYTDPSTGYEVAFCFREGIAEYVQANVHRPYAPIYSNEISAIGKERYNRREYQAVVKVALCFVPYGGSQSCYHNLTHMSYGGTHLMEVLSMICHGLNACFGSYIEERTGHSDFLIQPLELKDHLYLIMETWCSRFASVWENGTRQSIRNIMIKDMAHDLFSTEFSNYVFKHKDQLQSLVDQILASRH